MRANRWRERKKQWERFNEWERKHATQKLTPAQRLAEIGALVDRAMRGRRLNRQTSRELAEKVKGISLMRKGLEALSKAA